MRTSVLIFFSFLFISTLSAKPQSVRATNGVLDLRSVNWENNQSLQLAGEWAFYWNQLISESNISSFSSSRHLVDLPKERLIRKKIERNGLKVSNIGAATYHLLVNVGKTSEFFSINIGNISSSYELEVNGKILAKKGKVSLTHSFPEFGDQSVLLPPSEKYSIILRIANHSVEKNGFEELLEFGRHKYLVDKRLKTSRERFIFLSSFLLMGIYHLILFAFRTNYKPTLWFALFSFFNALRVLTVGDALLYSLFPMEYKFLACKLFYISVYGMGLTAPMIINGIFERELSGKILTIMNSVSLLYIGISCFTGLWFEQKFIKYYNYYILFVMLVLVYIVLKATIHKKKDSIFVLLILVFSCAFPFYTTLVVMGVIKSGPDVAPYGLMFFMVAQAILLSLRFSRAFKENEVLSKSLKIKSDELEDKNLKLIQLDKLKDEFLANTSHELRTPIHGIMGITDSLLDGIAGKLNDQLKKNLSYILNSSKRLSNLVDDLLDFSKLKHKEIQLNKKNVDVRTVVDVCLMMFQSIKDTNKDIRLVNELGTDLPSIYADEERVQQIFTNIIGNAIKFTNQGSVNISAVQKGDFLDILVKDSGIGIENSNLNSIFNSFEQADGQAGRSFGGTGLGLSISKQLIELHGGGIKVESEVGKGSIFTISFPISEDAENEVSEKNNHQVQNIHLRDVSSKEEMDVSFKENGNENSELPSPESKDYTSHILIVDDEPVNIQVLENHLSLKNFQTTSVNSGKKALELIEGGFKPDLILLDVMMPQLTGIEVCREIRKQWTANELPIIFLTAKNQISDLVQGFDVGANDFISKPFSKQELFSRILNHVKIQQFNERLQSILQNTQEISQKKDVTEAIALAVQTLLKGLPLSKEGLLISYFRKINSSKERFEKLEIKFLKENVLKEKLDLKEQFNTLPRVLVDQIPEELIEVVRKEGGNTSILYQKNLLLPVRYRNSLEALIVVEGVKIDEMQINEFSFVNTLMQSLSIVSENIDTNLNLENLVEERTARLREKTNDINSMLENIQQGIFTCFSDSRDQIVVHSEYSKHLEDIFETQDIGNKNINNVLFENSSIAKDDFDQVQSILRMSLNSDMINFTLNQDKLPREFRIQIANKEKQLEVEWSPIVEEESNITEKVMVNVRDVTEIRKLEKQAFEQSKELEMIGQLLDQPAKTLKIFFSNADKYFEENKALIEKKNFKETEVIKALFRNMHTVKGNARALSLSYFIDPIHNAEESYQDIQNGNYESISKNKLLDELADANKHLKHYEDLFFNKLNGNKVLDIENTNVENQMIKALEKLSLDSLSKTKEETSQAIHTILDELRSSSLLSILKQVNRSIPDIVKTLGKEVPNVNILGADQIKINNEKIPYFIDILNHLIRNSLDHGIETPDIRNEKKKNPIGEIKIQCFKDNNGFEILFQDDGQGVNVKNLKDKAISEGRIEENNISDNQLIVSLLLSSGFSSKEQANHISGRGVGLDAVESLTKEIGGEFNIELTQGETEDLRKVQFSLKFSN